MVKEDTLIEDFPHIIAFLRDIPENIWGEFMPIGAYKMILFENNLKKFGVRMKIRGKVMELQKEYGLPLHPNESLRRTMILVRIKIWKEKKNGDSKFSW